jgi:hypothetical protein
MFEKLEDYPEATILHHVEPDGTLWGTKGRWIMRQHAESTWDRIGKFPFAVPRDLFGFSRPTSRAMRADKSNLFVNSKGRTLCIRASRVYAMNEDQSLRPLFEIQGDSVLHGGICEDEEGWTYFGEYFMNPQRRPVRIWRIDADFNEWEVAYEFPPGSVRHIHGIYADSHDPGALWACTGDDTGECFFLRTTNAFRTMEMFGDGSQLWRAVRLHFNETYICWLTDSQLEQNYACRMRREDGNLERGHPIEAPVWYGTKTDDELYIAFTTVEPGVSVKRDTAAVLISNDGFDWQEIHSFEKDAWRPMKLFKYGVISMPSGKMNSKSVYMSGEGLVGFDGRSMKACVGEKE